MPKPREAQRGQFALFSAKPFWFLKPQIAIFESLTQRLSQERDLQVKHDLLQQTEKQLEKIMRLQTLPFLLGILIAFSPQLVTNIQGHELSPGLLKSLVLGGPGLLASLSIVKNLKVSTALTLQMQEAADVISLPKMIRDFPSQYSQENYIGPGTKADADRLIHLLSRSRASELLTIDMKEKLLSYCDSVDRYPRMDSDDKRWAAQIRSALYRCNEPALKEMSRKQNGMERLDAN